MVCVTSVKMWMNAHTKVLVDLEPCVPMFPEVTRVLVLWATKEIRWSKGVWMSTSVLETLADEMLNVLICPEASSATVPQEV